MSDDISNDIWGGGWWMVNGKTDETNAWNRRPIGISNLHPESKSDPGVRTLDSAQKAATG